MTGLTGLAVMTGLTGLTGLTWMTRLTGMTKLTRPGTWELKQAKLLLRYKVPNLKLITPKCSTKVD